MKLKKKAYGCGCTQLWKFSQGTRLIIIIVKNKNNDDRRKFRLNMLSFYKRTHGRRRNWSILVKTCAWKLDCIYKWLTNWTFSWSFWFSSSLLSFVDCSNCSLPAPSLRFDGTLKSCGKSAEIKKQDCTYNIIICEFF